MGADVETKKKENCAASRVNSLILCKIVAAQAVRSLLF